MNTLVLHESLPSANCRYSSLMLSAWLSLLSPQNAILQVVPYLHCIVWCLF